MDANPYSKYEDFFAPVSEVTREFVDRHGLSLEKYYLDEGRLVLSFRHPQGGVGSIVLVKNEDAQIDVYGNWWYDDFDTARRYAMKSFMRTVNRVPTEVALALKDALSFILSRKFGEWDHTSDSFEAIWKPLWTKQQFEEMYLRYPELKLSAP